MYRRALKKTNLDLTRRKKEFGGSVGRPAKGSERAIERWWRWRECKLRDAPVLPIPGCVSAGPGLTQHGPIVLGIDPLARWAVNSSSSRLPYHKCPPLFRWLAPYYSDSLRRLCKVFRVACMEKSAAASGSNFQLRTRPPPRCV